MTLTYSRVLGLALIVFSCRFGWAQALSAEFPFEPNDSNVGSPGKLDQQDQETCQLRSQIGALQNGIRLAAAAPPAENSAASDAIALQLTRRLDAIEQRLNQRESTPVSLGLSDENIGLSAG
jgi:hypothetical protein